MALAKISYHGKDFIKKSGIKYFLLGRGARQGDPISAYYLF